MMPLKRIGAWLYVMRQRLCGYIGHQMEPSGAWPKESVFGLEETCRRCHLIHVSLDLPEVDSA